MMCAMLSGGQVQFTLDVQGLDMSAGSLLDAHEQKPVSGHLISQSLTRGTRLEIPRIFAISSYSLP